MCNRFEKSMQVLAGSHLRIGFVVLLFGLSAGLLEFGVHTAVMRASASPRMQAMTDAAAVGFAAALVPLFVLLAARERHRKLLDDLRKIAQLNHHVRNALQTILYSEYLPASETTDRSCWRAWIGSAESCKNSSRSSASASKIKTGRSFRWIASGRSSRIAEIALSLACKNYSPRMSS